MKLTKLKIDAPRMHGIDIESGIKKKTVGTKYVCVKYIISTKQFGYDSSLYTLYYNVVIFFSRLRNNQKYKRVHEKSFQRKVSKKKVCKRFVTKC